MVADGLLPDAFPPLGFLLNPRFRLGPGKRLFGKRLFGKRRTALTPSSSVNGAENSGPTSLTEVWVLAWRGRPSLSKYASAVFAASSKLKFSMRSCSMRLMSIGISLKSISFRISSMVTSFVLSTRAAAYCEGRRPSLLKPSKKIAARCCLDVPYSLRRYAKKATQLASVASPYKNSSIFGSVPTGNLVSSHANLSFTAVMPALVYACSVRLIQISICSLLKAGISGLRRTASGIAAAAAAVSFRTSRLTSSRNCSRISASCASVAIAKLLTASTN